MRTCRPLLLLLVTLLLLPAPARAQVATRFVGLTAGATLSDLSAGGASSGSRWGFTAGAVTGAVTFDYSFIQFEPAWTQTGGDDLRLDYLDIPVLIGALVPLGNRSTILRMYGGVGVGFKLGCKAGSVTAFACGSANGTVWTLPVGISLLREVGDSRFIGLDARYAAPLSNSIDLGSVKTRSWQFRGIFAIPIGG